METRVVGFVGVGRMGSRMARRILNGGFVVHAFDMSPDALSRVVADGAKRAVTPADVAKKSDVVITVLPEAAAVEMAVMGPDGIVSGLRPGSVVVEMSTISPGLARKMAAIIEGRGACYLDCPVSGGLTAAEKGSLTVMVGGKADVLERCRDVLEPMAGSIYHMGDIGAGLTAKLINQLLTMTQTVLVTEALAVGARSGMDLDVLYQLIGRSSGNSWCWQNRVPRILDRPAETWVTLDICHKDLKLAKALGEELEVPLFVADGAFQVLQMAKAMQLGKEDVSDLGRIYERMLGIRLEGSRLPREPQPAAPSGTSV